MPLLCMGCPEKSDVIERSIWTRPIYGCFALVGATVGFGSIIFFPYFIKMYKAVYLIPFFINFLLIGIPLFTLELAISNYVSIGPIKAFSSLAPILSGVGWGFVLNSITVVIYYNLYLTQSFILFLQYLYHYTSTEPSKDVADGLCSFVNTTAQPNEEKIHSEHLMVFFFSWILVAIFISNGYQARSKMIVFVNATPFFFLILLSSLNLVIYTGSNDTLLSIFDFSCSWDSLGNPRLWIDALEHTLFTLGVGFGAVSTFASYNKFGQTILRDMIGVPLLDVITAFLGSYLIYKYLDDKREHLLIILCSFSGKMMPEHSVALIYVVFYLIGFSCQLSMVETIVTAILDQFETLRNYHSLVVYSSCSVLALSGCYMCVDIFVFEFLKSISSDVLMISSMNLALSAPIFSRHFDTVNSVMSPKVQTYVVIYLKLCWTFICPVALVVVVVLRFYVNFNKFSGAQGMIVIALGLTCPFISVLQCHKLKFEECFQNTKDFKPYRDRCK